MLIINILTSSFFRALELLSKNLFPLFSHYVMSSSFATLWTVARQASPLHGIFQARILE